MRVLAGLFCVLTLAFAGAPTTGAAQANLAFDEMAIDPNAPVELSADELTVNQADGTAVFTGNVRVAQGDMLMTAGRMEIEYAQADEGGQTRISRLVASGGVTLVTPQEAAEASEAVYSIDEGSVVLLGSVLLNQGPNAISGDRLTINLADGTGRIDGNVRTILQAGDGN